MGAGYGITSKQHICTSTHSVVMSMSFVDVEIGLDSIPSYQYLEQGPELCFEPFLLSSHHSSWYKIEVVDIYEDPFQNAWNIVNMQLRRINDWLLVNLARLNPQPQVAKGILVLLQVYQRNS